MQFDDVVESTTGAVHLWQSPGRRILATVPGGFHHPEQGLAGLHVT